jgi:hypothetical protein
VTSGQPHGHDDEANQFDEFLGHPFQIVRLIGLLETGQDKQADADLTGALAFDGNGGLPNALSNRTHAMTRGTS